MSTGRKYVREIRNYLLYQNFFREITVACNVTITSLEKRNFHEIYVKKMFHEFFEKIIRLKLQQLPKLGIYLAFELNKLLTVFLK